MFKKLSWILALILLLSLPALACGPFGGDEEAEATAVPAPPDTEEPAEPAAVDEPAAEPTTPPPAVEEPTEEPAEEPEPTAETAVEPDEAPPLDDSVLQLSTINELPFDSYRLTLALDFTGVKADGEEVNQIMSADFAFSTEPPANSMSITFTGIEEDMGMDSIEMAQIEETTYMVIPEMGCITTQGEDMFQDNPFAEMLAPDEFLQNLEDAQYEGEETVNGILTLHYSIDKEALQTTGDNELESGEGHLYIAKDGGFLVRMVMDATGKIDFFEEGVDQDGDMHIEINLTNVDEPVDIVMPAGCEGEAAGGGSEFPMVDDAYEISSFGGVVSYKTALTTEEVLAFYDEALAAEGWTKDEDGSFVGGGSALVSFTREDESLNLTIGPDDDTGDTFVVLLSEME
ncbi:MAG: hypothetical protein GY803_13825 [Chloroflexi bacterium]|nr:hypothetical protein [Chloroflexota bacterium]